VAKRNIRLQATPRAAWPLYLRNTANTTPN
jgi:hypothetical protein